MIVNRWLGFRLDVISVAIVIAMVFLAAAMQDILNIGLLGFALVYAISLSGLLQWTVRQSAEVENVCFSIPRFYYKFERANHIEHL